LNAPQALRPSAATLEALRRDLEGLECIADPDRLARLSQDFSWFSPVLKRQLEGARADLAARPRTEADIARVVGACARHRVPLTVRGAATGNYGQIVPLQGGMLLDLSAYNAFGWVRGGVGRAQAGIRLSEFGPPGPAAGLGAALVAFHLPRRHARRPVRRGLWRGRIDHLRAHAPAPATCSGRA
jgi:hypothetical protein